LAQDCTTTAAGRALDLSLSRAPTHRPSTRPAHSVEILFDPIFVVDCFVFFQLFWQQLQDLTVCICVSISSQSVDPLHCIDLDIGANNTDGHLSGLHAGSLSDQQSQDSTDEHCERSVRFNHVVNRVNGKAGAPGSNLNIRSSVSRTLVGGTRGVGTHCLRSTRSSLDTCAFVHG